MTGFGRAAGNFGFDVCRTQADIGLIPDTISSDLTAGGRGRVVYSLMECMGRFMAAGYTVSDMVRMSTANAAKALGLQDEIGAIAPGKAADLCVWRIGRPAELAYWIGMAGPERRIFAGEDA